MTQIQMSLEEKLKIGVQAVELRKQGKHEEAEALMKTIPVAPYLAKAAKETFGVDFLRQGGWSFSEANEEYGPGARYQPVRENLLSSSAEQCCIVFRSG